MRTSFSFLLILVLFLGITDTYAQTVSNSKQQFASLSDFTLESGEKILDCKIGYRTFGKLNADRSNTMVFLCGHTMTSEILQMFVPGMMADTTKYHVVLIDALANGISSSPSNSKKQPGLKFPEITIRDMVDSQYQLLTQKMNIKHIVSIWGVSMGALQTYQWTVSYPDFMDKALPYSGTPRLSSYDLLWGTTYLRAIHMDPAYNKGIYTKNPVLTVAPHIGQMVWTTPESISEKTPVNKFDELYKKAEEYNFDWNDAVRQIEAVMKHDITKDFNGSLEETAKSIKAKILVINIKQDHAINPILSRKFVPLIENGTYEEIDAVDGHMTQQMPFMQMRKFLNNSITTPSNGKPINLLGNVPTQMGDYEIGFNLFEDGTFDVFGGLKMYGMGYLMVGNWKYANGVYELTDEDTNEVFKTKVNTQALHEITRTFDLGMLGGKKEITVVEGNLPSVPAPKSMPVSGPVVREFYDPSMIREVAQLTLNAPKKKIDKLFRDQVWPLSIYEELPDEKKGKLEKVNYKTYAYEYYEQQNVDASQWEAFDKSCYVYLPYNYDLNKKYNIYYLLHGTNGNEATMFSGLFAGGTRHSSTTVENGDLVRWLDYMFANDLLEPFIMVTPTTALSGAYEKRSIKKTKWNKGNEVSNFQYEFERDLAPAVESKYSTYAASGKHEDLVTSREHRALGGFSMGATVVFLSMANTLDIVSDYLVFANAFTLTGVNNDITSNVEATLNAFRSKKNKKYKLGFLYTQGGTADGTHDPQVTTIKAFMDQGSDVLKYGKNLYFHDVKMGVHSGEYAALSIFNSLKVFFK